MLGGAFFHVVFIYSLDRKRTPHRELLDKYRRQPISGLEIIGAMVSIYIRRDTVCFHTRNLAYPGF